MQEKVAGHSFGVQPMPCKDGSQKSLQLLCCVHVVASRTLHPRMSGVAGPGGGVGPGLEGDGEDEDDRRGDGGGVAWLPHVHGHAVAKNVNSGSVQ